MKQSLQLRMSQNLTMTPQLQQAIKLLQLSTLDLQQEIQQALDSNMMLEIDEEQISQPQVLTEDKEKNEEEKTSEGSQTEIPDELPIDSNWDDVFENTQPMLATSSETSSFETQRSKSITLLDHLLEQLDLVSFSERDYAIAVSIIDTVNHDGYLSESTEQLYKDLQNQLETLDKEEVDAVLHRIQTFDPVGVAAKDLADCLIMQLLQLPETTLFKNESIDFVKQHLDLLATNDLSKILKEVGLSEFQLKQIVALIRTLDPKPGAYFNNLDTDYVIPDVFVSKQKSIWQVSLNPDITPKLRINRGYSKMVKRADGSQENTKMKEHLQEARWFIKNLHNRNETLLRVAQSIVTKQQAFLEQGAIAMKPMVLRDIAEELELHESTISRVTTQKYMHTPKGIVEFKYFFSSHVLTEAGGECSATAIRAIIKELIENENSAKPLSDSKMSKLLVEKGINVARRTIAKYRESMSIPSSSQRKRLL